MICIQPSYAAAQPHRMPFACTLCVVAQPVDSLYCDTLGCNAAARWRANRSHSMTGVHVCRLWDVHLGSCQYQFVLSSRVQSLSFHSSGSLLVTGCDDGDVCIWSIPDMQKTHVQCSGGVTSVVWNSTGNKVAAACRTKRIHLISVEVR